MSIVKIFISLVESRTIRRLDNNKSSAIKLDELIFTSKLYAQTSF